MKKLLIAIFVVFTFGFYTVYKQSVDSVIPMSPPQTQQTTPPPSISQTEPSTPPHPTPTPVVAPPVPTSLGGEDDVASSEDGGVMPTPPPVTPPTPTPTPAPTPKPTPAPAPVPTPTPAIKPKGMYADGSYTGTSADAYYGYVQVKAIIQGGKITDVQFLDHPQDRRTSQMINNYAMPYLTQEAVQGQSANVNIVSGATDTSLAFRESLASALAQAKN